MHKMPQTVHFVRGTEKVDNRIEKKNCCDSESEMDHKQDKVAGWTGLEPAAFAVTGRRDNQLHHHPRTAMVNGLHSRGQLFTLSANVSREC
jgi:hypothetical protein